MKKDEQFFIGQKAFIAKDNKILVLNDPIEGVDFPGGKIQIGEKDPVQSLKREVREETQIDIEVGEPFFTFITEFPKGHKNAGKKIFLIAYKCKYISGDVKLSNEHDNFVWVDKDDYKKVDDGTSFFEMLEKYFEY